MPPHNPATAASAAVAAAAAAARSLALANVTASRRFARSNRRVQRGAHQPSARALGFAGTVAREVLGDQRRWMEVRSGVRVAPSRREPFRGSSSADVRAERRADADSSERRGSGRRNASSRVRCSGPPPVSGPAFGTLISRRARALVRRRDAQLLRASDSGRRARNWASARPALADSRAWRRAGRCTRPTRTRKRRISTGQRAAKSSAASAERTARRFQKMDAVRFAGLGLPGPCTCSPALFLLEPVCGVHTQSCAHDGGPPARGAGAGRHSSPRRELARMSRGIA